MFYILFFIIICRVILILDYKVIHIKLNTNNYCLLLLYINNFELTMLCNFFFTLGQWVVVSCQFSFLIFFKIIFITCMIRLTYVSSGNNSLCWLQNNITWPFCMVTEVLLAVIFMFLFFAQCVLKITLKYLDDNIYFRLFFFFLKIKHLFYLIAKENKKASVK